MQIHQIQPKHKNKKSKTVGRGGKRGKTSGRGMKGQNARAGHKKRPEVREIIKKIPKLRGRGVNSLLSVRAPSVIVKLSDIERVFSANALVSPTTLGRAGLIQIRVNKFSQVKILSNGEITKAVKVINCAVSASAKKKIEEAGGSVTDK